MQYELFPEQYIFFSLGSGSSGNSYYLGNGTHGIMIDAGIGPRVTKKRLAEHGVDMTKIYGVLITHDHYDHIKSVAQLGNNQNIPIYATRGVHKGISANPMVKQSINGSRKFIEKMEPFTIGDFKITAFDVPHDSMDSVGYFIEFGKHRLMIATDVGKPTEQIRQFMTQANHLVIESNYDEEMLQRGSYPYHLKERITNGTGHLSNRQAAEFVVENFNGKIKNIWLCHLSGDNNTPELALQTMTHRLTTEGIGVGRDVAVDVFRRNKLSEKYYL